jgi:hypothetical protein
VGPRNAVYAGPQLRYWASSSKINYVTNAFDVIEDDLNTLIMGILTDIVKTIIDEEDGTVEISVTRDVVEKLLLSLCESSSI